MNSIRAQQILESEKEFTVLYEGVPVWIQNVDVEGNTARVYTREDPDNEMEVNVTQLNEE